MRKKICICGHFGFGYNLLNGQTVKTKTLTEWAQKKFGIDEILTIDTHGGKFKQLKAVCRLWGALRKCDNVIILPAHNGLRIIAPVLSVLNRLYHRKLHYVVIGGWLADFLMNRKRLTKQLKKFDAIYVETHTLEGKLIEQGLSNIVVMPNCKDLHILQGDELVYSQKEPYKLCTFSRVMKEKGIGDIIEIIKSINGQAGYPVYELDIYGQVDCEQEEWFETLQATFPEYVRYRGVIPFEQSVEILKNYFLLIFPTKFYTEGVPGTIIDAYAAGVPVISARWESFHDVIDDGETGIGYEFDNLSELKSIMLDILKIPEKVNGMKENCIEKAKCFDLNHVFSKLML